MPTIQVTTHINATPEICFDLSRSIELHLASTAHTQERVVAGKAAGLCEIGDTVTWEAIHFGIRQRLTVGIIQMTFPSFFEDKMLRGAFKQMAHQHYFTAINGGTEMKDVFTFETPLDILGKLAEWLVLNNYMKQLLQLRNCTIKKEAEQQQSLR